MLQNIPNQHMLFLSTGLLSSFFLSFFLSFFFLSSFFLSLCQFCHIYCHLFCQDHPRAEYEFRVMQKSLKKDHKSQVTLHVLFFALNVKMNSLLHI